MGDVLDTDVPATVTALSLILVAAIVTIWGVLSIVAAYPEHGRPDLPRWHPRRWVAPCFGFFLGWFLIVSDAVVYGATGFRLLRSTDGIELGWAVYLVLCGALAMVAFWYWSREQLAGRGGR